MRMNTVTPKSPLLGVVLLLVASQLAVASSATLSLDPSPSVNALSGETVAFDVWLHDYQSDNVGDAIISFGLNVAASDPALTDGGADFSGFNFTLDPGLAGIIGGLPLSDTDISDDGRVDIGADLPAEPGITDSDVLLGSLTVVAPDAVGLYGVDFQVDPLSPINGGGTFLVLDDANFTTLPGDGDLRIVSSAINVVPEASTMMLAWCALLAPLAHRRARRRRAALKV